jgi:glycosyltransferase involved in cell wall biosynthesis
MITPFTKAQRGNSLTAARIKAGLTDRGFEIDLLSLEDHNWPEQLRLALRQSIYSLVHGFHALHFGQVLQSEPALSELPLILTITGTDIYGDLWGDQKGVVVNTMQAVRKIVLFNDDHRHRLSSTFPEFHDKTMTIPQGVYLEKGVVKTRQELGFSSDEFIFLLPSGLRHVKNIEMAIDALTLLHQEDSAVRLLIIGAVIEEEYSHAIIDRISSLPWIKYLGEVPHDQMAGILTMGDVVLNTSHSEGQPQAALEAMSLGKPCILTAVPGNLNLIQEGREGYYVDNREDLFSAAHTMLNAPARREEMGRNARRLAETRFTLGGELDAYSRLYQEIIGIKIVEV